MLYIVKFLSHNLTCFVLQDNCELPIVETVLKRLTIRGSIVGTRKDAQECLDFAVS